jgi:hypothetical protein
MQKAQPRAPKKESLRNVSSLDLFLFNHVSVLIIAPSNRPRLVVKEMAGNSIKPLSVQLCGIKYANACDTEMTLYGSVVIILLLVLW